MATIDYGIKDIGRRGIPAQILKSVVCRIIIRVTRHQAFRTRADERLKHKSMDVERVLFVVRSTELDCGIPLEFFPAFTPTSHTLIKDSGWKGSSASLLMWNYAGDGTDATMI